MDINLNNITAGSAHALVMTPANPSGVGIILYPTIFGIDDPMHSFAKDLAYRAMTVVIWDPYRGEPAGKSIMEVVEKSKTCQDQAAVDDLRCLTDYMERDLGLTRIAGVGWCFGGRIGLLHAGLDQRVNALCSYNPTILPALPVEIEGVGTICRTDMPCQTMDEFALAEQIQGPVQVTRPADDFTQPADYDSLVKALFSRTTPTFYEYYPGVGHGFSYIPGEENQYAKDHAWRNSLSLLESLKTTG